MSVAESDSAHLKRLLAPLVGAPVREARLSELGGSFISIRLGGSLIWVHLSAWKVESDSEFLVACEDRRDFIRASIAQLDGRSLHSIAVSDFLDITFDFNGLRLMLFNTFAIDANLEMWSVELSSGQTLFVNSGGSWKLLPRH
ncbi:hypothetical protein [Micromonospora sp. 067-2]|uniref:hypothetical protein n=1 Tax=Micromonospora sp. 067-2 TaxID=2789270 RepID=UPI003979D1D7